MVRLRTMLRFFAPSFMMKHATTIMFVVGFGFDLFFLPEIGTRLSQYLGIGYLACIALGILIREWLVERNRATKSERILYSMLTYGIAYFQGSALSFVFVYAIRGSALSVAWPLIVILLLCSIVNELVASHNYRFTLDIGVLYVALLFYVVFNLPVLLKSQNDSVFLICLLVSAVISIVYMKILSTFSEVAHHESPRGYALALGVPMFVGMLYMLNVIPAVPLSLKEIGVYHHVKRYDDGSYLGKYEPETAQFPILSPNVFHRMSSSEGVFVFASVNAPAELKAPITHVWEWYNPSSRKWEEKFTSSYLTSGGRTGGYRAYSQKDSVADGFWRVTVKADQKRVVGRITFEVVTVNTPITLRQKGL